MTLRIGNNPKPSNQFAPRARQPGARIGFTLIELVLVILLISILTGLSTPLFRRTFSDILLRNAAFDMSKLINYAQEMAIIDKLSYKLNLELEKNEYRLTRRNIAGEATSFETIKGRYGKVYSLPGDMELDCDKEEVLFYPDGRSDEVEIEIRDKKKGTGRKLTVKGFGAQLEIEVLER